MGYSRDAVVVLAFLGILNLRQVQATNNRFIPDTLKIGVANAAPQIEGGWNEGGKGETIWDRFARTQPERIVDHSTPAVACDSYHKWRDDLAIVKDLGCEFYRMSIAWARILPNGYHNGTVNQEGVDYYKNIFVELKKMNVEPLVTLYHWDLPQKLQDDLGGWLNAKTADLFAEYARICFQLFGDYVKWWVTINEPKQVCNAGYAHIGGFPPGVYRSGVSEYVCAKNVLLAHAKAFRIYDKEFRAKNKGNVAMVMDTLWMEPGSKSPADVEAAQRALEFSYGLYGHPIYFGDWPKQVKDRVALRSKAQSLPQSRLPEFTPEEKALINGTHDYLTLNYYSAHMASATPEAPFNRVGYHEDMNVKDWINPDWPKAGPGWFSVWPMGLRKALNWLKNTYGNHPIIITENGYSDYTGQLDDPLRAEYFRDHLSNCLDATYEDKVNLIGYMAWTFMDDWEWGGGFRSRIGMYKVDFNSPNKTRIRRSSALAFKDFTTRRCLVKDCVR